MAFKNTPFFLQLHNKNMEHFIPFSFTLFHQNPIALHCIKSIEDLYEQKLLPAILVLFRMGISERHFCIP